MNDSVGRAVYYKPMHLWDNSSGNLLLADFSTQFSIVIDSQKNCSHGDGFAFFLAPNGSKIPNHSGGSSLGLQCNDPTIDSKFVAVEFNTFSNTWDPTPDHVAIDLNSVKESLGSGAVKWWWWSDIANAGKVDAFINDFTRANSSSLSTILDLSKYLPEWVTFGFSGTTGLLFEIHTIYSWNFNSTLQVAANTSYQTNPPTAAATSPTSPPVNPRRKSWTWLWVVLGVAGGIVTMLPVLALLWFFCWRKKYGSKEDNTMCVNVEMEMVTAPREFSYKELEFATRNFAEEGLLGEGGFGKVYLGFLRDMNCDIAVKRITPQSRQGVKEYESEVRTISRLRHRNLVQLIGWCHDNQEFLVVYEFLPKEPRLPLIYRTMLVDMGEEV
ncbi:hypothetical protein CRYUN_Cryun10bG0103100 [Craigia yunnanensis]